MLLFHNRLSPCCSSGFPVTQWRLWDTSDPPGLLTEAVLPSSPGPVYSAGFNSFCCVELSVWKPPLPLIPGSCPRFNQFKGISHYQGAADVWKLTGCTSQLQEAEAAGLCQSSAWRRLHSAAVASSGKRLTLVVAMVTARTGAEL